ncbi:MAG: hypothetical protein ACR2JF_16470 [Iamia sp.]
MPSLLLAHQSVTLAGEGVPGALLYAAAAALAVIGALGLRARGAVPVGGPAVAPLTADGSEVGPWPGDALAAPVRLAAQVIGVAALAVVLGVGWLGSDLSGLSPVPLFLVLVWWTVPLLSWALGDWWRAVDPHDALAAGVDRLRGRPAVGPEGITLDEEADDWWLPALLLASFAWMATCWIEGLRPRNVTVWLTLLTLFLLVGAVVGGRSWVRRTSPLAVLCGTMAAAAPVAWTDGRVALRSPFRGVAARAGGRRSLAALTVVLGASLWEAVSGTQWWSNLSGGSSDRALVWSTLGLVWCVLLVAAAWLLVGRVAEEVAVRTAGREVEEPLGPDLAVALGPLAAVAVFIHQLPTWTAYLQDLAVLGLDPLSKGWNLFGSSAWRTNEDLLSPGLTSGIQLTLLGLALALGLVAGWDRLAARTGPTVATTGWAVAAWTAGAGMVVLWLLLGA